MASTKHFKTWFDILWGHLKRNGQMEDSHSDSPFRMQPTSHSTKILPLYQYPHWQIQEGANSPGVGVNAPMPNVITLVNVEIVTEGPASSSTKLRRWGTEHSPGDRNQECTTRNAPFTPINWWVLHHNRKLQQLKLVDIITPIECDTNVRSKGQGDIRRSSIHTTVLCKSTVNLSGSNNPLWREQKPENGTKQTESPRKFIPKGSDRSDF